MTIYHFHKLKVSHIQAETADSVSVVFSIPDELKQTYRFIPGQHLVMKADIEGEEVRRNYSICSGIHDEELRIAVKKIDGGVFSTFVNEQLQESDELEVMPPEGGFYTPLDKNNRKNYLAFAAGSGITPVLSIVKSTLELEPESTFTLVYGNKTVASIMFREQLLGLKNRYPERFELINILSREDQESELLNGRIDAEKLSQLCQHVIELECIDEVFLCGPQQMTDTIKEQLIRSDFPEKHIHFELFGTSQSVVQSQSSTDDQGPVHKVGVIVDGKQTHLEVAQRGKSILDVALDAGADLPFACKGGVCSTCKAKVLEGRVQMDVNYALEDDELEAGFVLTCQAHPVTDHVVVDFDEK